jgi:hypothetical protein
MKKVQINQAKTEIDWSKKQWVQSISDPNTIVLTTGFSTAEYFTGTAIPCEDYPYGSYADDWFKKSFQPLVGEIQFTISNED